MIDGHDAIELFNRRLERGLVKTPRAAVDQAIQRANRAHALVDKPAAGVGVGQVFHQSDGAAVKLGLLRTLSHFFVHVGENQLRAGSCENPGDAKAKAVGRASDQNATVRMIEAHRVIRVIVPGSTAVIGCKRSCGYLHMISSHSPENMFSLASGFSGWARISSSSTSTPQPGLVGML